jgi:hypothetical protein
LVSKSVGQQQDSDGACDLEEGVLEVNKEDGKTVLLIADSEDGWSI